MPGHAHGPFDESEFARRRQVEIAGAGTPLWIKSPEDSVLRKLCWYREGGEVPDRQWRDLVGVLRLNAGTLEADYLRRWANQLRLVDLLDRALADAAER